MTLIKRFKRFFPRLLVGIAFTLPMGFNLGCGGGGGSNATPPASPNPVPAIVSVSPTAIQTGTGSATLSITGNNFISASAITWNGTVRSTNYISSTLISTQLTLADLQSPVTVTVAVVNPAPGGGTSNLVTVTIQSPNPQPTAYSMAPTSATAGDPAFTLRVNGSNFMASSTLNWNGSARPTTYVSPSVVTAQISANDIANSGPDAVTVTNPAPGGGSTYPMTFNVGGIIGAGASLRSVHQMANRMAWDPIHHLVYLSIPSTAGANGNSIAVLDPTSASITTSQFAGSEPNLMAVSDDATMLYVSLDGSNNVKRFTLPSLTPDISIDLGADSFFGSFWAKDLQVAPGSSNTIAVSLGANRGGSPEALGGVAIFDGSTQRPTKSTAFGGTGNLYDSIQWGSTTSALYGANNESTGFDFYTLTVTASGVTMTHDYGSVFNSFWAKIHFDRGANLVYSDDGHIVDPSTGHPIGTFAAQGYMVPDSSVNRAFFLGQTQSQFGTRDFTLVSFDLSHFTPVGSITISGVSGNPIQMIRYGTNGLAFNTDGGRVYLINGAFIAPNASVEPIFRTW